MITFASERTALTLNPSPTGRGTLKSCSPSPRGRRGWGMRANKDDMLPIALASRVDIAQPTNAFVGMVS